MVFCTTLQCSPFVHYQCFHIGDLGLKCISFTVGLMDRTEIDHL